jgi:hypothetical protein
MIFMVRSMILFLLEIKHLHDHRYTPEMCLWIKKFNFHNLSKKSINFIVNVSVLDAIIKPPL